MYEHDIWLNVWTRLLLHVVFAFYRVVSFFFWLFFWLLIFGIRTFYTRTYLNYQFAWNGCKEEKKEFAKEEELIWLSALHQHHYLPLKHITWWIWTRSNIASGKPFWCVCFCFFKVLSNSWDFKVLWYG